MQASEYQERLNKVLRLAARAHQLGMSLRGSRDYANMLMRRFARSHNMNNPALATPFRSSDIARMVVFNNRIGRSIPLSPPGSRSSHRILEVAASTAGSPTVQRTLGAVVGGAIASPWAGVLVPAAAALAVTGVVGRKLWKSRKR